MIFLLFDDPCEAYNATRLKRSTTACMRLGSIVTIGRKQHIYLWDLKVLASLSLGVQLLAESFQIEVSPNTRDYIDPFINHRLLFDPRKNYGQLKECVMWCLKIKGKEYKMFNPFRIKLHKMFHNNSNQVIEMTRALHLKFYGFKIK